MRTTSRTIYKQGKFGEPFLARLPLLAGLLLLLTVIRIQAADDSKLEPAPEHRKMTVSLVQNQKIVGIFLNKTIAVKTKYGKLTIPTNEIVRMRLSPHIDNVSRSQLVTLLELVASEKDDSTLSNENLEAIAKFGRLGGMGVIESWIEKADASRQDDLKGILASLRKDPENYFGPGDEVITERFTLRGDLVEKGLRFDCLARQMNIPREDILQISFRKLDLKKTLKVGPQHMEQNGFLVSEIKVRKGQRITLEPSGQMTHNGQSFGPAGISNHTWNSRKLGCLQWRIGQSSPWKLLPTKFEGKCEARGVLQFSVHLYNSSSSGEFKIVYRTKVK